MRQLSQVAGELGAVFCLVCLLSGCMSTGAPAFGLKLIGISNEREVVIVAGRSGGSSSVISFNHSESSWRKVYEYPKPISGWDLAPDTKSVALTFREGNGDGTLWQVVLDDGASTELLREDRLLTQPLFSADGKRLLVVLHDSRRTSFVEELDVQTRGTRTVSPRGEMYVSPFYFGPEEQIGGVRLSNWGHYSPIASSTWQTLELVALPANGAPKVMKKRQSRVDDPLKVIRHGEQVALVHPAYMEYEVFSPKGDMTADVSSIPLEQLYVYGTALSIHAEAFFAVTWGERELLREYHLDGGKFTTPHVFDDTLHIRDADVAVSADGQYVAATLLARDMTESDFRPMLLLHDKETTLTQIIDIPAEMIPWAY